MNLIIPNKTECTWGTRYLLFQLFFLGDILVLGARLLGITLNATWLNILYFTINFVVAAALCRRFLKASITHGLKNSKQVIQYCLIGFLTYQFLAIVIAQCILLLKPDFANVNDQTLADISQGNFALMAVCTVLMVPLTEEIFYRGVIFGGLYRRNRFAAYAVSVLVFALVHVSGYVGTVDGLTLLLCFVQYLPAGFFLAFAYEKSGTIVTPIMIHLTVNAIGMLAMG